MKAIIINLTPRVEKITLLKWLEKKLQSDYSISTIQKYPKEVGDIICDLIMKLVSGSEKSND